eukprot:TRINITY_DN2359_c0_g1_i1.p1 TRINITY_DN2359_c0_g1~~TRINITY_DN2359_c0_g1_i1.p1  ORF type:complete len:136 (-),score=18.13 TRINITY_DN2359_c0_g1_i1:114-470(-)
MSELTCNNIIQSFREPTCNYERILNELYPHFPPKPDGFKPASIKTQLQEIVRQKLLLDEDVGMDKQEEERYPAKKRERGHHFHGEGCKYCNIKRLKNGSLGFKEHKKTREHRENKVKW